LRQGIDIENSQLTASDRKNSDGSTEPPGIHQTLFDDGGMVNYYLFAGSHDRNSTSSPLLIARQSAGDGQTT
jgi:hypothetical protein